jgi:hypothetical protein
MDSLFTPPKLIANSVLIHIVLPSDTGADTELFRTTPFPHKWKIIYKHQKTKTKYQNRK